MACTSRRTVKGSRSKSLYDEYESEELEEYKETQRKSAETLLKEVFPRKVIDLDALYRSEKFDIKRLGDIKDDLNIPVPPPANGLQDGPQLKKRKVDENNVDAELVGSKVYALPNGSVPSNRYLLEVIDLVKPEIRELIDNANTIKMWITFLIPKIEDGNNFGVSVQEDTVGEARAVESEAATYLDQISRYFITRGKLISKIAKYPHIDDYRRTIVELDEKEFISIRLVVCELRNQYASLHDLVQKNLDKIKKPRNMNAVSMY